MFIVIICMFTHWREVIYVAEKSYIEVSDKGKELTANILAMKDLQIMKWQRVSMALAIATTVAVAVTGYTATRSTFIPYVVSVDEETGYVNSLGALTEVNHEPTDAEIGYFLSRFVEGIRSIPADTQLLSEQVKRATMLLTPDSAKKFKGAYLSDLTEKIQNNKTNRVKVLSVTPIKGTNSYQVRWEELDGIDSSAVLQRGMAYSGTFSIERKPVSDKETLKFNPLGLFVKDFSISEEGKISRSVK